MNVLNPKSVCSRLALIVVASTIAISASSREASALFISTWKLTNDTGMTVSDFHGTFRGTGGSTANPMILANDGPGMANIAVGPNLNDIVITWSDPFFAAGNEILFSFETFAPPIIFDSGTWTFDAIQGGPPPIMVNPKTIVRVPEPSTLPLCAIGLAAVCALTRRCRRKKRVEPEKRDIVPLPKIERWRGVGQFTLMLSWMLTVAPAASATMIVGNITGERSEFSWSLRWDGGEIDSLNFEPPNKSTFAFWTVDLFFTGDSFSVPPKLNGGIVTAQHKSKPTGDDHNLDGPEGKEANLSLRQPNKDFDFGTAKEIVTVQELVMHPSGEIKGGHSDLFTFIFTPTDNNAMTLNGGTFLITGKHLSTPVPVPEPSSAALLISGIGALALTRGFGRLIARKPH